MLEKLFVSAPQWLITIAVLAFVIIGAVKYMEYLKTRPARTNKLPEPILSKIATEEKRVPDDISYSADTDKVDFGFSQGVKFAFGFWTGTILFTILCVMLFGSLMIGAAISFIQHSVQSAFTRQ